MSVRNNSYHSDVYKAFLYNTARLIYCHSEIRRTRTGRRRQTHEHHTQYSFTVTFIL